MVHLKVLLAVLVWGASFSFTKLALEEVSPLSLVLALISPVCLAGGHMSLLGGGLILLGVCRVNSGRPDPKAAA